MSATDRDSGIAERLRFVRASIEETALRCGRDPSAVHLVVVTKGFPSDDALEACRAGASDLGENRVQEMLGKADELSAAGYRPRWHLIGTLQKNKVKYVIGRTALIHSVDSLELLEEISVRSSRKGVVTDVLLQVNVSGEDTKHGFDPAEAPEAFRAGSALEGVRLRGLMTMAPLTDDPGAARPVFEGLRDLLRALKDTLPAELRDGFDILSMGMSHDYPIAIECGATHVRIGTAILGTGRR